jgi:hypothetical protein
MAGRVLQVQDFATGDEVDVITMERLERRLAEECGAIRLDIRDLRAEMIDRNNSSLRWLLGFFLAQTTAIGALFAALR